jgi:hypothetical protein
MARLFPSSIACILGYPMASLIVLLISRPLGYNMARLFPSLITRILGYPMASLILS